MTGFRISIIVLLEIVKGKYYNFIASLMPDMAVIWQPILGGDAVLAPPSNHPLKSRSQINLFALVLRTTCKIRRATITYHTLNSTNQHGFSSGFDAVGV